MSTIHTINSSPRSLPHNDDLISDNSNYQNPSFQSIDTDLTYSMMSANSLRIPSIEYNKESKINAKHIIVGIIAGTIVSTFTGGIAGIAVGVIIGTTANLWWPEALDIINRATIATQKLFKKVYNSRLSK